MGEAYPLMRHGCGQAIGPDLHCSRCAKEAEEASFCERLAAMRAEGWRRLEAVPSEEHIRACDYCWHFCGLEVGCPDGKALLDRIYALERALGMRA